MSKIYADLHMHTPNSDGEVTLEELPQIAKENNLQAVAITDHDKVHDGLSKPLEIIDGVEVISGIELRVESEYANERIDLLGYGVEPTNELKQTLKDIQNNRIKRTEKILDLIEEETNVRIDMEISTGTGRPHIARAIDESTELSYDYNQAFEKLIGNNCPAYVSREIPTFEKGIKLLKESCHFVSLAHPFRYNNPVEVLKLSQNLNGVECIYSYGDTFGTSGNELANIHLDEIAVEWFDLNITGGSDAHTIKDIGTAGLMKSHYETFLKESKLNQYIN